MNKNNLRGLAGLLVLALNTLACEPVIAIGWREILIVFVLAVILLGPLLFRLIRRLEDFRRNGKKKNSSEH